MGKFYAQLDDSFDDFLATIKQKKMKKDELIKYILKLKSTLILAYNNDNGEIDDYFKIALTELDFKI
jgi:hypothetical protein